MTACGPTEVSQVSETVTPAPEESDFIAPDFDPFTETIPGSDVTIEMMPVPGGSFLMGRRSDERGKQPHEGPQRKVSVDSFWMAKHETTWQQYDLFVKTVLDSLMQELDTQTLQRLGIGEDEFSIPSPPYVDETYGMGKTGFPAVSITHFAAVEFAKWLSAKTGRFYRLPTEAEWEYACRAGSRGIYSFGNNPGDLGNYEWYRGNSGGRYGQVASLQPNAYGLYDMQGNVAEWTMDQYFDDYHERLNEEISVNPWFRPDDLYPRAVRGGSWRDEAPDIRCTMRQGSHRDWSRGDPQIPRSAWWHTNTPFVGFRLVRPVEEPSAEEIQQFWIEPRLDF